ncbi:MAG: ABC transporter permease subunit [Bacteroidales bacterium]|nr:ABC transporter permease subunit [Candidatus Colimorpha onthohippi]
MFAILAISSCKQNSQNENADAQYYPQTLDELSGKTVAVVIGGKQDINITEQYPEINLLRLETPAEVVEAVEKGKAYACVIDTAWTIGFDLLNRGIISYFRTDIVNGDVAVAFNKREIELCQQFNNFLVQIVSDGTFKEIEERWTNDTADRVKMPDIPVPTKGKPLRIGTSPTFPFNFIQNNEWSGLENEMMRRFAVYINRPIEYQNYNFGGLVAAIASNKVDLAASSIMITPERAKMVLFSNSYRKITTCCFGRKFIDEQSTVNHKPTFKERFNSNLIEEDRWRLLLDGFVETIIISFFAILFGTILGGLVCWFRMRNGIIPRGIAKVYITILQGVPILVFLMVMFYLVFASPNVSATWVAIIAFSMNFAAYACEIFRTGIESIDQGQYEAGYVLGFNRLKTFTLIILPQAIKRIIPVYKGQVVSIIKSTSVVGYIAIQDLTKASDLIRSRTFDAFFPLIIVSIIYFLISWGIGKLMDKMVEE